MRLIVFDVETKRAFDEVGGYFPAKLGVSLSGVYYQDDKEKIEYYRGFREAEFPEMFKLFERADRIVGFNTLNFDLPALAPYYVGDLMKLPNLDIMAEVEKGIGHRVSLDSLAKETLGIQKSGHGLDALTYYHEGNWEALEKYCLQDVKVTKLLYEYGLKHGKLSFKNKWNRIIDVNVSFEVINQPATKVQTTLF